MKKSVKRKRKLVDQFNSWFGRWWKENQWVYKQVKPYSMYEAWLAGRNSIRRKS